MSTAAWTLIGVALGGLITLLGVYLQTHWQESRARRRLSAALYEEIRSNYLIAQIPLRIIPITVEGKHPREIGIEHIPLDTIAYDNMRASGELLTLDEELQAHLRETYTRIYDYNRDTIWKYWLKNEHEALVQCLKDLEDELPRKLEHLRSKRII